MSLQDVIDQILDEDENGWCSRSFLLHDWWMLVAQVVPAPHEGMVYIVYNGIPISIGEVIAHEVIGGGEGEESTRRS